jgi:hypothetical protein
VDLVGHDLIICHISMCVCSFFFWEWGGGGGGIFTFYKKNFETQPGINMND